MSTADFIERRLPLPGAGDKAEQLLADAVADCRARGATWMRATVKPITKEIVVEGWRVRPEDEDLLFEGWRVRPEDEDLPL